MATMTLLEIVQATLSAMNSDEVNSIDESAESLQVVDIVRDCYYYMVTDKDWPFQKIKSSLTGLADTDNPTKMRIPTTMEAIEWIKYNKKDVIYKTPKEFQDLLDGREEETGVIDADGYVLNRDPVYWTTYDDDYIWFDGYDSDTDSTLQESKSVVYGTAVATFTATDDLVLPIPSKLFPTFLAEVKAEAFLQLKQEVNQRQERKAKRGRDRMQADARRAKQAQLDNGNLINYGRK